MSRLVVLVLAPALAVAAAACSKKVEHKPAAPEPAASGSQAPADKPVAPAAATPPAKLVALDLSPLGDAFKGVVAMVPEGATLDADAKHITLSETDYVAISEAPYWEDGVASLEKDKDNKNLKKVSATQVTYERTPPLGTAWGVDVLVTLGAAKFSCTAGDPGTFTSAARRDQIAEICKSIKPRS